MIRCIIADDEELARKRIVRLLEKHGRRIEIDKEFESGRDIIERVKEKRIDILFLDIEMPTMDGFQFIQKIKNKDFPVIITTAYNQYAIKALKNEAVDYLLKPIFFERFFSAIQKFLKLQHIVELPTEQISRDSSTEYVFVNKAKKQIKVTFDEVLYVESLKDYIKIHLQSHNFLVIKESISTFEKRIDNRFIRLHRSYIVNSEKITAYTKNDVEIGRIEIPIGNNYKDNLIPFLKSI